MYMRIQYVSIADTGISTPLLLPPLNSEMHAFDGIFHSLNAEDNIRQL